MCAPLVEAVAAQADRHDVDRLDVAERRLGLLDADLTASSELVLELPTSSMILMTAIPPPSVGVMGPTLPRPGVPGVERQA
jgi:hypothetical protein